MTSSSPRGRMYKPQTVSTMTEKNSASRGINMLAFVSCAFVLTGKWFGNNGEFLGIRVFITDVKGTFFGMSESEEASKRRWNSYQSAIWLSRENQKRTQLNGKSWNTAKCQKPGENLGVRRSVKVVRTRYPGDHEDYRLSEPSFQEYRGSLCAIDTRIGRSQYQKIKGARSGKTVFIWPSFREYRGSLCATDTTEIPDQEMWNLEIWRLKQR